MRNGLGVLKMPVANGARLHDSRSISETPPALAPSADKRDNFKHILEYLVDINSSDCKGNKR
jgi:hypothetical protein